MDALAARVLKGSPPGLFCEVGAESSTPTPKDGSVAVQQLTELSKVCSTSSKMLGNFQSWKVPPRITINRILFRLGDNYGEEGVGQRLRGEG